MQSQSLRKWVAVLGTALMVWGVGAPSQALFWGPSVSSNEEIFGFARDIVNLTATYGHRRPGSPGEEAVARHIAGKFREFGLTQVAIESVPLDEGYWNATSYAFSYRRRTSASATSSSLVNVPTFSIPYTKLTAPNQPAVGSLAYVGEGADSDYQAAGDLRGKVVVAEIRFLDPSALGLTENPATWVMSNWEAYDRAVAAGASAFVGILRDYWESNQFYSPTDNPKKPFATRTIPGLWITKSQGDALKRDLGAGLAVPGSASVRLEGTLTPPGVGGPDMHNVVGVLPGTTSDVLLIHSHHDSAFLGAVEDASGVAEVLAIAKYFGQIPASWRKKTLVFLSASGHFYNYKGNRGFIAAHSGEAARRAGNDWIDRALVDFCVEHVAREYEIVGANLVSTGSAELSGTFVTSPVLDPIVRATHGYWGVRKNIVSPYPLKSGFFTDAKDYQELGTPVVSYISGPAYIYDPADTLDKINVEQLRPVAAAFIDAIIATDELSPSVITQY